MILILKGADFSSHNIGTLDSYFIQFSPNSGIASHNVPTSIKKNTSLSATITIKEGYELGSAGVSVTMGGNPVTSGVTVNGNTITINIASVTANIAIQVPTKNIGGSESETYTITYKYMSGSTSIKTQTTEQVAAGTVKIFSTSDAPTISGYIASSVSPSGSQTINGDITVTYNYTANAASGTTVNLTSSNAVFKTTDYHLTATNPGGPLGTSTQGTKGVMAWDIPTRALVTLTCSPGGNYGMAITNSDGTVALETLVNSSVAIDGQNGTYTFSPVLEASRLYVSTTKFVSASYVILTDEELKQYDFNVTLDFTSDKAEGKYINTSQTVGNDVQFATMNGVQYAISNTIPANSVITLYVKTGGSYGMCIADENGKVLQNKPSGQADADGIIVFDPQSVPCKLWVSMTKFTKATYKLGG